MLKTTHLKISAKFTALLLLWLFYCQGALIFSTPKFAIKLAELSHLPKLEVGDWVLREGTVLDSQIIMQVSQGDFSHIGMIVRVEPEIQVIHATTDDGGEKKQQVLLSPLNEFLSPNLALNYMILRPRFLNTKQKQQVAQTLISKQGVPFVLASREQPHLYCTTLLAESIQQVHSDFSPRWQNVNMYVSQGDFLFPQAFLEYPKVEDIYRLKP